jgi:hypothetical protein
MDNLKLPVALVLAMAVQLAGGVWWVSQQAATIADLEEAVEQFASKMAVEDSVNLKRDVQDNADYIAGAFDEIDELWEETEELWDEAAVMAGHMTSIMELQQRVALLENSLKFLNRIDTPKADMR